MRPVVVCVMAVLSVAVVSPTAAARAVEGGTLRIGRGVDVLPQKVPVRLGTRRGALVRALGRPLASNRFGYLRYARQRDGIFDLFVNPGRKRLDLIVVSLPGVCTPRGICLFEPGGLGRLQEQFGLGLDRVVEAGDVVHRVRSRLGNLRVTTDFQADGDGPEAALVSVSLYLRFR